MSDDPSIQAPPVFAKAGPDGFVWPAGERTFYVLGSNGLFVCRNHRFFRSCVPARNWPTELGSQATFLRPDFPKLPRRLVERVVGFFDRVAERHGSEAAVLLAWDPDQRRVRIVVPDQRATVSAGWSGHPHPIGLHYTPPTDLPPGWVLFGDVHSHVNLSAYASETDVDDEEYSAGLHLVVGRLYRDPPEFHCAAVADGVRFDLSLADVSGGYAGRNRDVPAEWLERVTVEDVSSTWSSGNGSAS